MSDTSQWHLREPNPDNPIVFFGNAFSSSHSKDEHHLLSAQSVAHFNALHTHTHALAGVIGAAENFAKGYICL